MKTNIGTLDKTLRIFFALSFFILFLIGQVSTILATIGFTMAAIFIVTSFISYCPVCDILGINGCKRKTNRPFAGKITHR
jgi:hypothetical protein